MEIVVKCNKCGKELEVLVVSLAPGSYDVTLEVEPCKSKDCGDCSTCQDMKYLKLFRETNKRLQEELQEAQNEGASN